MVFAWPRTANFVYPGIVLEQRTPKNEVMARYKLREKLVKVVVLVEEYLFRRMCVPFVYKLWVSWLIAFGGGHHWKTQGITIP